jgi:hypothetical protein
VLSIWSQPCQAGRPMTTVHLQTAFHPLPRKFQQFGQFLERKVDVKCQGSNGKPWSRSYNVSISMKTDPSRILHRFFGQNMDLNQRKPSPQLWAFVALIVYLGSVNSHAKLTSGIFGRMFPNRSGGVFFKASKTNRVKLFQAWEIDGLGLES